MTNDEARMTEEGPTALPSSFGLLVSSLIRHSGFVILVSLRTLAIDLGPRRVGLALSDEGGRFATPYDVLVVTSPQQTTELVLKVVEKEGAERLVVGLPLNMDGSSGPAARAAVAWGRSL